MTRVSRARSHRGVTAAAPDLPRAAARKKKPYKIVLEAVTQEKRKLKSSLTYHDQAPPGFGYVPVGHPDITEWCKEQCRQRNLDVHIVSAKPRSKAFFDPEKISSHVHRIGHHFPLEIIDLACRKFNYRYSEGRGLRRTRRSPVSGPAYVERGIANYEQRQGLHSRPVTDSEHKEHIRGAIREIFPKIPDADLTSIVNHAFEEGTNRVGNAKELSLARRVQLAVVAHIRHTYTEYDNILKQKTGSWMEARQRVEHVSLAKLKEWRDETDEASNELEETFREVIVLDDDEDSSEEESSSAPDTREASMEIVSSRATARDLQPELVDRMRVYDPYVSGASRRTIVLRDIPMHSPREQLISSPSHAHFHSQANRVDGRALALGPAIVRDPSRIQPGPYQQLYGESPRQVQRIGQHVLITGKDAGRPLDSPTVPTARVAQHMMRDSTGQLFTLQPIETEFGSPRVAPSHTYRHADQFQPYETSLHPRRPRLTPSSRRASDQDVILPSVEREPDSLIQKRKSLPHPMYEEYPDARTEEHSERTTKRRRPVYETYSQREVDDLTYSPSRPAYSSGRGVYEVVRPRAALDHVPVSARQAFVHDPRVYREAIGPQSPRAYVSETDRVPVLPRRRLISALDPVPSNRPPVQYETRDSPYMRSNANHGYYATH